MPADKQLVRFGSTPEAALCNLGDDIRDAGMGPGLRQPCQQGRVQPSSNFIAI